MEMKSRNHDNILSYAIYWTQVFFGSFVGWILWDDAIPAIFPTLVKAGHLPADVGFWALFGISVIIKLLLPFSMGGKIARVNPETGLFG